MQEKKCSKCGTPFGCCADGSGCWCENYTITPETLSTLKQDYPDCLCEACLKTYGTEKSTVTNKE